MKLKISHLLNCGLLLSGIATANAAQDEIEIPFRHAKGMFLFEKNCSTCHGVGMTGTDKGPPLLHAFYKPSHHNDASFYRAGLKGVKAHHWNFGDMPPVPGMTERNMKRIVSYVRFYQQQKNLYQEVKP